MITVCVYICVCVCSTREQVRDEVGVWRREKSGGGGHECSMSGIYLCCYVAVYWLSMLLSIALFVPLQLCISTVANWNELEIESKSAKTKQTEGDRDNRDK